jgi:hypothetical protein
MTTPTRLDPRVFSAWADSKRCPNALKLQPYFDYFEGLFGEFTNFEGAWLQFAIALDLCAHVLRDEQRRARK